MATKFKPILKDLKELFNKVYKDVADPNRTNKQNTQAAINRLGKMISEYTDTEHRKMASLTSVGLKAMIDDLNGELTHYFISDKSLLTFLRDTEIKDRSIVVDYVNENKKELNTVGAYSIAVQTEDDGLVFTYLQKDDTTYIVVTGNDCVYDFSIKAKNLEPECKMAINFIYYIKAYPEKIFDGVPQDMVKNDKSKYNSSKSFSIGIAEEIVEKSTVVNGHLVSPHFRSGYFRHYTDDRYVNMKGKVQFIAATMVKGRAKTIVA